MPSILSNNDILNKIAELIDKANPQLKWVLDNCIFLHFAGSRLYGTSTQESDLDIRGITIAPKSYWVGGRHFEQLELKSKEENLDIVIYDIRKWLKLSADVNPNVIETLFVNEKESILLQSSFLDNILQQIHGLLNKRAYVGFHGYSVSQLKKISVKQEHKTGRREIIEKLGFDTKFASHAFRLAREGVELLTYKTITFPRPDREELLAIRHGKKYLAHELDKCTHDLEEELRKLDEAYKNTTLPAKYCFEEYNRLLEDIYDQHVSH